MRLYFEWARAAVAASGVVLEVIHRYKYQRAVWFEPFLARLLKDAALPSLSDDDWDLVVPVPLHRVKRREREFNQAERLAYPLARALGLQVEIAALRRVSYTETQTRFGKGQRARNVRHAFRATTPAVVRGHNVVLVDDVLTTGATANACAWALRRAGARRVCVWTAARGL